MSKLVLAASLLAAFTLAACAGTPPAPEPSAQPPVASPSSPPDPSPPATPAPSVPTTPSPKPPAATPDPTTAPTPTSPNAAERYLIDGVLRGARDCEPVRDSLPRRSLAGIECGADDPHVARVGFYLFANDDDMLGAYFARMKREGIATESGSCLDGPSETSYIPYEEPASAPYRVGCFINSAGDANYRLTLPGAHVYVGVLGRSDDITPLDRFAWLGSRDTPGYPTLWGDPAS
jgi:hypothetical protein